MGNRIASAVGLLLFGAAQGYVAYILVFLVSFSYFDRIEPAYIRLGYVLLLAASGILVAELVGVFTFMPARVRLKLTGVFVLCWIIALALLIPSILQ